jgi:molybdate transport system substrate-binding protein
LLLQGTRGRAIALLTAVALCVGVGASGASAKSSRATAGITVFAASSLTDVFPKIDPGNDYSFAGSNALATQIANGAPADVFASANTTLPAQLFAAGTVEKPVVFTRNTLVAIVPKANPADIKTIYDIAKPGVKVDIANSAVPVGSYTLQIWKQMGLTAPMTANVVSQETDVRIVLQKVQLGQADAGFVYATDARTVPGDVTVIPVPAWAQPKVAYSMAVVTRSPNQAAAQAFVNKVMSSAGQAWLLKYGFLTVSAPVPSIMKVAPKVTTSGKTLTILGRNFTGTTSVTFQGVPARFKVRSTLELMVTVPSKAKTGSLTVTTPNGSATWKKVTVRPAGRR